MDKRKLDHISTRLARVREWLGAESGYTRAAELQRLIERDIPELIGTIREQNQRGQQGRCMYCRQQLRLILGPRAGLYAVTVSESGVISEDPNCPSEDSPDGKHAKEDRSTNEREQGRDHPR